MIKKTVLVVGLPGSGKTTWVRQRLGPSEIAYDLDQLAGALRLKGQHEEWHPDSRKISNDLLPAILKIARSDEFYFTTVYVIRTAPTFMEAEELRPDEIVFLIGQYDVTDRKNTYLGVTQGMSTRLKGLEDWATSRGIPCRHIK